MGLPHAFRSKTVGVGRKRFKGVDGKRLACPGRQGGAGGEGVGVRRKRHREVRRGSAPKPAGTSPVRAKRDQGTEGKEPDVGPRRGSRRVRNSTCMAVRACEQLVENRANVEKKFSRAWKTQSHNAHLMSMYV